MYNWIGDQVTTTADGCCKLCNTTPSCTRWTYETIYGAGTMLGIRYGRCIMSFRDNWTSVNGYPNFFGESGRVARVSFHRRQGLPEGEADGSTWWGAGIYCSLSNWSDIICTRARYCNHAVHGLPP